MGGAIHPDELLAQLTPVQWSEWIAYCRHWLTPQARADVNAAMIRQACGHWGKKAPPLKDLLVEYGPRRPRTMKEMLAKAKAWAESFKTKP